MKMRFSPPLWLILLACFHGIEAYQSCPYAYLCECEVCIVQDCFRSVCGADCGWGGCSPRYCDFCSIPYPIPCNCAICTGFYCDCEDWVGCLCFVVEGFCTLCVTPFECLLSGKPLCINRHCVLCPC
jgi:hypothetical protein